MDSRHYDTEKYPHIHQLADSLIRFGQTKYDILYPEDEAVEAINSYPARIPLESLYDAVKEYAREKKINKPFKDADRTLEYCEAWFKNNSWQISPAWQNQNPSITDDKFKTVILPRLFIGDIVKHEKFACFRSTYNVRLSTDPDYEGLTKSEIYFCVPRKKLSTSCTSLDGIPKKLPHPYSDPKKSDSIKQDNQHKSPHFVECQEVEHSNPSIEHTPSPQTTPSMFSPPAPKKMRSTLDLLSSSLFSLNASTSSLSSNKPPPHPGRISQDNLIRVQADEEKTRHELSMQIRMLQEQKLNSLKKTDMGSPLRALEEKIPPPANFEVLNMEDNKGPVRIHFKKASTCHMVQRLQASLPQDKKGYKLPKSHINLEFAEGALSTPQLWDSFSLPLPAPSSASEPLPQLNESPSYFSVNEPLSASGEGVEIVTSTPRHSTSCVNGGKENDLIPSLPNGGPAVYQDQGFASKLAKLKANFVQSSQKIGTALDSLFGRNSHQPAANALQTHQSASANLDHKISTKP